MTYVGSEDRLKAQFDKHASTNMKLLLEDVTAHRYFEGVHLEPALKELGLAGLGPDPPTLIEAELSGGGADDKGADVALIDFQFVGSGLAATDLAHFVCGAVDAASLLDVDGALVDGG